MFLDLLILIVSAAVIVASVRYLLIGGISRIGASLKFSAKIRGQMIGYATSVPEFTVLVAGALNGVFDAGMWNIASSNVINGVLFIITVLAFRQQLDLRNRVFADEITFAVLSVVIPFIMFAVGVETGVPTVVGLLALFVLYKVLDKRLNKAGKPAPLPPGAEDGTWWSGTLLLVCGIALILLAGRFLGTSAGALVKVLNVPAWAVGWVLGLVTSVCELASFVTIYRIHKPKDSPTHIKDTQEALDALVASNVANLGLILPLGMLVYIIIT